MKMKVQIHRCRFCKAQWAGRKPGLPLRCPRCSRARWQAPVSPENARPQARAQDNPAILNR